MKRILASLFFIMLLASCTNDIPYLKTNGKAYLESMGFEVIGYEGFQWGIFGGKCWFLITDPRHKNIRYSVFLIERAGEINLYNTDGKWDNQKQLSLENE